MKQITYLEWSNSFAQVRGVELDTNEIDTDPESCTFYDNGAVSNSEGDFIVKADQVRKVTPLK